MRLGLMFDLEKVRDHHFMEGYIKQPTNKQLNQEQLWHECRFRKPDPSFFVNL